MRIISNFKDYYDFSGFSVYDGDYRETVYLRKAELKLTDEVLESAKIRLSYGDRIISKWWDKNKKAFSLRICRKQYGPPVFLFAERHIRFYLYVIQRKSVQREKAGKSGFQGVLTRLSKTALLKKNKSIIGSGTKGTKMNLTSLKSIILWKNFLTT